MLINNSGPPHDRYLTMCHTGPVNLSIRLLCRYPNPIYHNWDNEITLN